MQKFFKIAGGVFITAAIIMIVMFACNGCPSKETVDKSAYDSALADQAERNRNFQWAIDSLTIEKESSDSQVVIINRTKDLFKQIAADQKKQTDKYANMYRAAKALLDTNVMILSCDSLVDEYQILAGVHEQTIRFSDSVIAAQFRAIAIRDTIISQQQSWIKSQVEFIAESDSSYNALYKSMDKLKVRQKKTKRLAIVAVIAAFIGGVLIAK